MDPSLREQLESAGLRGRDLREPELAELRRALEDDPQLRRRFKELLQYDARLAEGFDEVPVPAGLRERLLAAAAEHEPAPVPEVPAAGLAVEPEVQKGRRGWKLPAVAVVVTVAATLLVALGIWQYLFQPGLSGEEILRQAPLWVERLDQPQPAGAWIADWPSAPRTVPRSVLRPPVRYQTISLPADDEAVVFELSNSRRYGKAWLFVLKPRGETADCPSAPPAKPCSLTGGRQVAYWQCDGMLYVLVMNGSVQDYRATLRSESPV